MRSGLLLTLFLVPAALGSFFQPPSFVREACNKWCARADAPGSFPPEETSDATDACNRCRSGPETNPACQDDQASCTYCQNEIAFPRSYPKLYLTEPSFAESVGPLQGTTRCWCHTGCPVYSIKSVLFCWSECSAICVGQQGLDRTVSSPP